MAKLPDKEALGGLPGLSVPGGLPRVDGLDAIGRGYRNIGEGIQKFGNALEVYINEKNAVASTRQKTEFAIGLDDDYTKYGTDADYANAPARFEESANKRLAAIKSNMSPTEWEKFEPTARLQIVQRRNNLLEKGIRDHRDATIAENDDVLNSLKSRAVKAFDEPDNPNWGYYDEQKRLGLELIDSEAKEFRINPKAHKKRRQKFLEEFDANAILSVGETDPARAKSLLQMFKEGPPEEDDVGPQTNLQPRDRDLMIRTVIGEAANEPEVGQAAVAHVILNRMKTGQYGGSSVPGVVFARHQFEPWTTRRSELESISPESSTYKRVAAVVDRVLAGEESDPTSGATHFYSPSIMAQRGGAPKWSLGKPQLRIGGHNFLNADAGRQPVQVAQADTGTATDGTVEASARTKKPGVMISDTGMTLRPETWSKLDRRLDTLLRSREQQAKEEFRLRQLELKQASDLAKDEIITRYLKGGEDRPTLDEVANHPALNGDAKKMLWEWLQKPRQDGDGPLYVDTWKAIGKTVKTREQLEELVNQDLITPAGYDKLVKRLEDAMGTSENNVILKRFFENVEAQFKVAKDDPTGLTKDPKGTENFLPFWARARKQAQEALQKGITVDQLVDPKNEHYLGRTVDSLRRTRTEIYSDLAPGGIAAPQAAPLSGPKPATPAPKRTYDYTKKEDVKAAYDDKVISRKEAEDLLVKHGHVPPKTQAPSVPTSR